MDSLALTAPREGSPCREGDLRLMRGVAAGEDSAGRELLALHLDAMYRFARHALASREGADDVVQAALGRAVEAAGRYDGRASVRTWLLTIAWRETLRHRRRRVWLPILGDRGTASREIAAVEDAEWVRAALRQLSPPLRAAFALVHVEELSVAEAAGILGIPEGTVKSRVHAAKARLREYLEAPSEVSE